MKTLLRLVVVVSSLFAIAPAMADTAGYPTEDNPTFLFDYPSDWELERGEDDTDFFTLSGPTGVLVQLRHIADNQAERSEAAASTVSYFKENYSELELTGEAEFGSPGMAGSMIVGSGLDSDKVPVAFAAFFLPLPSGDFVYASVIASRDDKVGKDAAGALMNSIRAP
jgi:hypothetical protein